MKRHENEEARLSLAAVYLGRAMRQSGCPICRRVREAEERWIWNLLYELTGDPEIHARFAASLGLCREHAALTAQVVKTRELVTPTGVARLYETVVTHALEELANLSSRKLSPQRACPLCQLAQEVAERESWFLGRLLADPEFWAAYENCDGLCLPHFLLAWREAPVHVRPRFLSDFQERLARLLERLRELQRKERFDVDEAPTPEELESWQEALWRLGGMAYGEPLIKRD